MHLILVGASHSTAPLALRERLAFTRTELPAMLTILGARPETGDAVVLSTCNRTEVYATCADTGLAADTVIAFLCESRGVSSAELTPHLYVRTDADAARHLFRVAAGLDSLVIGEPEVLGQVKDAYRIASESQGTGAVINRVFHGAFGVGKRVRSETGLSEGAVSLSYAGVTLARKIFGRLDALSVLVLGAGEMARLAALHFHSQRVKQLRVATRTFERASALAAEASAETIPWDERHEAVASSDVLISATGAPEPVLSGQDVAQATRGRRGRPLFILDLAVPRDVDPAAADLEQVFLYNLDDLRGIVHDNLDRRASEIAAAEDIVGEEAGAFAAWLRARVVVPTVVALRQRFEHIRRAELERLAPKLAALGPEAYARVDDVTRLIVEKLLLTPTEQLKAVDDRETMRAYSGALRRLFDLADEAESERERLREGPADAEIGGTKVSS
jgi:glutamyl-tRNA reductase